MKPEGLQDYECNDKDKQEGGNEYEMQYELEKIIHSLFLIYLSSILQPFIKPTEEFPLPEDAVLRLQHKLCLSGEEKKFGRHTLQPGCIEGLQAFRVRDTEVITPGDDHDGCVPVLNSQVRCVLI